MVTLRPLIKEDLQFLLEVRNDESTRFNLENNSIFTLKQCEEWFDLLNFSLVYYRGNPRKSRLYKN
jgi:hypothetical protein